MQIPLKGDQRKYVIQLLSDYAAARQEVARPARARPQALTFSAPTGAGKTVMTTAFIENVIFGGEEAAHAGLLPMPETTILWFSDNPELNEQSRRRVRQVSDRLPDDRLVTIPNSFDQQRFDRGKVYFLNTQKLRSGGLLVSPGNRRNHTLWETIANTEADRPGELILVVDEAHRGLGLRNVEINDRTTILSRLINGDDQQAGIGLVMGITATPARFEQYIAGTDRTIRRTTISPAAIRSAGIIKERLTLHGVDERGEHVWTMFQESIARLRLMEQRWHAHMAGHPGREQVDPLLLIQVEDRTTTEPSATPLGQLVEELRESWPDLGADQLVHCFAERDSLQAAGWTIPHMDPSDISDTRRIRAVIFKTALNTGWDCPRAEVLMSFRAAQDQTAIAQLVGRMVRTPLGHRVEGDDELNSAFLYLPRFNRQALLNIKRHLTEDDGGNAFDVDVATDVRDLVLRTGLRPGEPRDEIFKALYGLTFDSVPSAKSKPDLHRLFTLTRKLDIDGLAQGAGGWTARATGELTDRMVGFLNRPDDDFARDVRDVRIVSLTLEDGRIVGHDERRAELSDSDIERAYKITASVLSPELAAAWLRLRFNDDDPILAKTEFLEVVSNAATRTAIEDHAAAMFDEIFAHHLDAIRALPEDRQAEYLDLRRAARRVQTVFMTPPTSIRVEWPADGTPLDDHMYVEPTDGTFVMTTSEWEVVTLREARREGGFQAFLRNYPRKSWSLSYAYDDNGYKPGFPDFLVVREDEGRMVVDVLEPHRGEDSLIKARGMASFAERHGQRYGRIHMLRYDGERLLRLRLEDAVVRGALAQPLEQSDFVALFD